MKRIVYTSPWVPAALIEAAGLAPSRIMLSSTTRHRRGGTMGRCPFAEAFIDAAAELDDAAAVIVDTTCDQMRRGGERLQQTIDRPVFVMNVPATWQTVAPQMLYRDELRRLIRFTRRLGGTPPDRQRLAETVLDYDTRRARLRGLEGQISPRRFAEALARFARTGEVEHVESSTHTARAGRVPLALVGGPLRHDELKLFDRIERLGGTVALDGTETGLRCLAAPVDRRAVAEDPLEQLAEAYLGGIADPYQRPNSRFFRWLSEQLTTRELRGLIVYRYVWCDRWAAELRRLHDWSPVPVLELDQDETTEPTGRGDTRLEAFMELIGHTR